MIHAAVATLPRRVRRRRADPQGSCVYRVPGGNSTPGFRRAQAVHGQMVLDPCNEGFRPLTNPATAWDWSEPLRIGPAHTGLVRSVAGVSLPDGRVLIVSGGGDWALVFWPVRPSGQVAGEVTPPPVTDAVSRTDEMDDESFRDILGRGVLAAHLEELLVRLTGRQRAGTAVVHIDGRWGSGKSRLVTLLEQRMAGAPVRGERRLRQPIVIRYDAWRESAVAPEWWSVATAINRAVHGERAAAARVAMTLINTVTRVARSLPVVISATLLAAILAARLSGWWSGDIQGLGTALTLLAAVATAGLAAGRVLFWSAPAFGRLHLRAEDNPLGEIAAVVASLRRWSPREGARAAACGHHAGRGRAGGPGVARGRGVVRSGGAHGPRRRLGATAWLSPTGDGCPDCVAAGRRGVAGWVAAARRPARRRGQEAAAAVGSGAAAASMGCPVAGQAARGSHRPRRGVDCSIAGAGGEAAAEISASGPR
jgi:KAP family P-loop domain